MRHLSTKEVDGEGLSTCLLVTIVAINTTFESVKLGAFYPLLQPMGILHAWVSKKEIIPSMSFFSGLLTVCYLRVSNIHWLVASLSWIMLLGTSKIAFVRQLRQKMLVQSFSSLLT